MALITSPDVLPEAMRFLLRAVLSHTGARCNRAELLLLVAPEGLPETMKPLEKDKADGGGKENNSASGKLIVTRSLTALMTLKFVEADGSDIAATDVSRRQWSNASEVSALSFSRALRTQVWQAATAAADTPSDERVDDLVNGLAVLHAWPEPLRPFEFETGSGRRFNIAQTHWYGPNKTDWPVTNDVQFAPFCRWAAYLGYAQYVDTKTIIADASPALLDDLRPLPPGRYSVTDFIDRCADAMPVSDHGLRTHWKPEDLRDISPGLSLTLSQLEASGHIAIPVAASDRDSMVITLSSGAPGRRISHLDWHPQNVAKEHA